MKTIQKLLVLGLFVAGTVIMVAGCGDKSSTKPDEKPAAKTDSDDADKEDAQGSENASMTPAADGLTKVSFNVTGMT